MPPNPNNVQFDSDQQQFKKPQNSNQSGGLDNLLIKSGIVKDKAGSNKVLLIVLAIVIILIIIINF